MGSDDVSEQDREDREQPSVYIGGSMNNSVIGNNNRLVNSFAPAASAAPPPARPPRDQTVDYDLAFSFAGSDRTYVEATKLACERLGLDVMYDRDLSNEWWGENYIVEQRVIYGRRTRYFVPFISHEYFRRPVPADEFAAALWTDVQRGGGYILPVIIGDVAVPPERLHPHIGYLRAEAHTPESLANELLRKVDNGKESPRREPRGVDTLVGETLGLRPQR
jgi:hypothetical protein